MFRYPLALALLLSLAACSDLGRTSACDAVRACDIRQASCQSKVYAALGCFRGGALPARPTVEVVTPAALDAHLGGSGTSPQIEAVKGVRARWTLALRALGLLASPTSEQGDIELGTRAWQVQNADSAYDPVDNTVFVLDRGQPLSGRQAFAALLQGFVRATQEANDGVTARLSNAMVLDETLRRLAMLEGEAAFYEVEALKRENGVPLTLQVVESELNQRRFRWDGDIAQSEAPWFTIAQGLAAAFGGQYAARQWALFGDAAVRGLTREPVGFSTDLLAGAGQSSVAGGTVQSLPRACPLPPGYPGAMLAEENDLGAMAFYGWLLRQGLPSESALALARRVRGHGLGFYGDDMGRTAIAWQLVLAPASLPASDFDRLTASAGVSFPGGVRRTADGQEAYWESDQLVLSLAASDSGLVSTWATALATVQLDADSSCPRWEG